jgi:PEP-CTERM putative exosortase interaction domain
MKYRAIAWVAAVLCVPSAYAVDVNWDSHATTETYSRNVAKNVTFTDDARYLLTPAQSGNTGVQALFQLNSGTIANLRVDFYGDFYGPDKYLGSFTPTGVAGQQSFSFEHLNGRKKYYYLITGTTGASGANYTLTSNLVPDSVFHTAVAPVPEPSTYAMFALGAVLLPVARRLRQKRGSSGTAAQPNLSAACAA